MVKQIIPGNMKDIILNEQIAKLKKVHLCEEKKMIIKLLDHTLNFSGNKLKASTIILGIRLKLAEKLKLETYKQITPVEFRKHIQEIRERAVHWLPKGTWLVANSKGYWLTDDVKVADKYFKGVWTRKQSAQAQYLNYEVSKRKRRNKKCS